MGDGILAVTPHDLDDATDKPGVGRSRIESCCAFYEAHRAINVGAQIRDRVSDLGEHRRIFSAGMHRTLSQFKTGPAMGIAILSPVIAIYLTVTACSLRKRWTEFGVHRERPIQELERLSDLG